MRTQSTALLLLLGLSLYGCVSKQPYEEDWDPFGSSPEGAVPVGSTRVDPEAWTSFQEEASKLAVWLESRTAWRNKDSEIYIPSTIQCISMQIGGCRHCFSPEDEAYRCLEPTVVRRALSPEPYNRLQTVSRRVLGDFEAPLSVRLLALNVLHSAEHIPEEIPSFFQEMQERWNANPSPDNVSALACAAYEMAHFGEERGWGVCEKLLYGESVPAEAKWRVSRAFLEPTCPADRCEKACLLLLDDPGLDAHLGGQLVFLIGSLEDYWENPRILAGVLRQVQGQMRRLRDGTEREDIWFAEFVSILQVHLMRADIPDPEVRSAFVEACQVFLRRMNRAPFHARLDDPQIWHFVEQLETMDAFWCAKVCLDACREKPTEEVRRKLAILQKKFDASARSILKRMKKIPGDFPIDETSADTVLASFEAALRNESAPDAPPLFFSRAIPMETWNVPADAPGGSLYDRLVAFCDAHACMFSIRDSRIVVDGTCELIKKRLGSVVLPEVNFRQTPLRDALAQLHVEPSLFSEDLETPMMKTSVVFEVEDECCPGSAVTLAAKDIPVVDILDVLSMSFSLRWSVQRDGDGYAVVLRPQAVE